MTATATTAAVRTSAHDDEDVSKADDGVSVGGIINRLSPIAQSMEAATTAAVLTTARNDDGRGEDNVVVAASLALSCLLDGNATATTAAARSVAWWSMLCEGTIWGIATNLRDIQFITA